jgi:c-di-GMP-binding flagellar brake protein YcgR
MTVIEAISADNRDARLSPHIQKLKYQYDAANLTSLVKSSLGLKPDAKDVFYIKSEIKRLSMPCARLIDLRNYSSGQNFSQFTWEHLDHVLDKDSAQEFLRLLKDYNGEYTFGVYEGVIAYFKSQKNTRRAKQFTDELPLDVVSLSDVFSRNEERMNLGIKVNVISLNLPEDSEKNFNISPLIERSKSNAIEGNTIDISLNGLQVRLKSSCDLYSYLAVRFSGFEDDFLFNQKYILYRVVKITKSEKSDDYLVALKQVELSAHKEFQLFTRRLIYSNKRRYKISLDNTFSSVKSKLYEQFYLSRRRALDLFVDNKGEIPYLLASDPSLDTVEWFSQNNKGRLASLISKDDVLSLAKELGEVYWIVLKVPCEGSEKFSYYSTVASDALSYGFASYALRTGKGKIFKVKYSSLEGTNPFITSSLPRSVHKEMGGDSIFRYSPKLNTFVDKLDGVLTIKEITNGEMDIFDNNKLAVSKGALSKCSKYLLKKIDRKEPEVARLESNEFRKEDRFAISTTASFSYKGKLYEGTTIDISSRGMSLKLVDKIDIPSDTELKVIFNDLSAELGDYEISSISYKVIQGKSGLIRAEMLLSKGYEALHFWNEYISNNIDRLSIVGNTESMYGLKRVLRNVVSQMHDSVPAFYSIKDSRPYVRSLAFSSQNQNNPLWSSINGNFSIETQLKSFLHHEEILKTLLTDVPKINRANPFNSYFIFVGYQTSLSGKVTVSHVSVLPKKAALESFICKQKSLSSNYRVFNLSLTKKSKMFDRYFKDEMRYLETYALHKAKKLMFEVKTLTGVLDFNDVTELFNSYAGYENGCQ